MCIMNTCIYMLYTVFPINSHACIHMGLSTSHNVHCDLFYPVYTMCTLQVYYMHMHMWCGHVNIRTISCFTMYLHMCTALCNIHDVQLLTICTCTYMHVVWACQDYSVTHTGIPVWEYGPQSGK